MCDFGRVPRQRPSGGRSSCSLQLILLVAGLLRHQSPRLGCSEVFHDHSVLQRAPCERLLSLGAAPATLTIVLMVASCSGSDVSCEIATLATHA